MTPHNNLYKIRSEVFLYPGMAGWHFIGIPKKQSADIKKRFSEKTRRWGTLPVLVKLYKTVWETSIFPDKKSETYLLPIKAGVRRKEGVACGDKVSFTIQIKA